MKFVTVKVSGPVDLELPIIFPNLLVHAMVAAQIEALCKITWPGSTVSTVSAGEVNMRAESTHGKSDSLGGLKARESDGMLINTADYGGCMMGADAADPATNPFDKLNQALAKMHKMLDDAGTQRWTK